MRLVASTKNLFIVEMTKGKMVFLNCGIINLNSKF